MFFGKTLFSQNTIDGRDVNIASHMVCQQVVLLLLVGSVVKGLLLLQLAGIGLQQVVNEGLVVQYAMYIGTHAASVYPEAVMASVAELQQG